MKCDLCGRKVLKEGTSCTRCGEKRRQVVGNEVSAVSGKQTTSLDRHHIRVPAGVKVLSCLIVFGLLISGTYSLLPVAAIGGSLPATKTPSGYISCSGIPNDLQDDFGNSNDESSDTQDDTDVETDLQGDGGEINTHILSHADGWVYTIDYEQNICKVKSDGTQGEQLTFDRGYSEMIVLNGWIYAVQANIEFLYNVRNDIEKATPPQGGNRHLVKMDLDGQNDNVVAEFPWPIYNLQVADGNIYFIGGLSLEEQNIYRVNPDGSGVTAVLPTNETINGRVHGIVGEWVYCNIGAGICRMNLAQQNIEVILKSEEQIVRAERLTIYGDTIYYSDGYSVCSVQTDGTGNTLLWEKKDSCLLFMKYTDGWLYYYGFFSDTFAIEIGRVKADGSEQECVLDGRSESIYWGVPDMVIKDNWIYFLAEPSSGSLVYFLYRVTTDGTQCQFIDYHPTTWEPYLGPNPPSSSLIGKSAS